MVRLKMLGLVVYGAIVQRIGHRPSKSTMLVRFQLALPNKKAPTGLVYLSEKLFDEFVINRRSEADGGEEFLGRFFHAHKIFGTEQLF